MFLSRFAACALGAALALTGGLAAAQEWPSRPIRIVVTFPTGGAPDILARLFSEKSELGQPVIVDNKPGAGGNIGADIVAKSPADGYTLVMGTVGTHSINGSIFAKMPYDMTRDFAPISLIASTPNLLVVNNDLPVKTVKDLIDYAKANPDKLSFGSPGLGTSIHVSGELFKSMTGVQMQHIPYKGRQFAIPDLIGGQIQLMFDNMPSALPMARDGKIRAVAQTGAQRSAAAPDVPTVAESGVPGFEATSWFALFAPAGTPPAVIAKIRDEAKRIYSLPDVRNRLATLGLDAILSTPAELAEFQAAEIAKWAKVAADAGVKVE
ncbi:MAG: tripartite tricarboxylate transporter substrate binding protein [Limnobacter sp.]|nr:tripartite tricarboxylate transporter substrate binding protein [Limnobacter sp.]